MTYCTRELHTADRSAARRLGQEAFGMPDADRPDPEPPAGSPWPGLGAHALGTFHGEELAARAVALDLATWADGRQLRTCGVAGVNVAAGHTGLGGAEPRLGELARRARGGAG